MGQGTSPLHLIGNSNNFIKFVSTPRPTNANHRNPGNVIFICFQGWVYSFEYPRPFWIGFGPKAKQPGNNINETEKTCELIVETWEMLFSLNFDSSLRVGDTLLSTPDHSGLIFDQKLNSQETTLMRQKRHVNYVQLGVYLYQVQEPSTFCNAQ